MFTPDSLETTHDTLGNNRTKKNEEVQDLRSASGKTTLISPDRGGDGEEINGTEFEKKKGKVTSPRDDINPHKKRKVCPPKPSS
jgi:hypothetical protein